MHNFWLKMKESLSSTLPIVAIVLILHFMIAPIPSTMMAPFLTAVVLLILGMAFFNLGADIAMSPMGEAVGSQLTRSRNLPLLIIAGFLMGVAITIAEPDLEVLAQQVPAIPNMTLIVTIAIGVGFFLVIALLRIVLNLPLPTLLFAGYLLLGILACFAPQDSLPVAFDSGGVTTGPITVPFIMALGVGVAAVRTGKHAENDSFGLVALCSIGPILAVLLLGMFYDLSTSNYVLEEMRGSGSLSELMALYGHGFGHYFGSVALAISPILAAFFLFQIFALKLPASQVIKMCIGIVYTYLGLVLFLTSVNIGFMPVGNYLGGALVTSAHTWIIIPVAMVMGFFIVFAEPAIHVLKKQVEEITAGSISQTALLLSVSIGVAFSMGLAMLRVVYDIAIWVFLLPGYAIALLLTFFVPKIFTAIAFDSGGVASGPMTATFMLPFSIGACAALNGNIMTDAFGLVAMVAMTPLITVQLLGLVYAIKDRKAQAKVALVLDEEEIELDTDDEDDGFGEEPAVAGAETHGEVDVSVEVEDDIDDGAVTTPLAEDTVNGDHAAKPLEEDIAATTASPAEEGVDGGRETTPIEDTEIGAVSSPFDEENGG